MQGTFKITTFSTSLFMFNKVTTVCYIIFYCPAQEKISPQQGQHGIDIFTKALDMMQPVWI